MAASRTRPTRKYAGTDDFIYELTDGEGETVKQYVTITVVPPPAPAAQSFTVVTPENTALKVAAPGIFAGATGTGLGYDGVIGPSHGTAVIKADGSYTYTPNPGYTGPDQFNYFIDDEYGRYANAFVNITVSTPVTPPVAKGDSGTTPYDTPLKVLAGSGVLGNDTGTAITVTSHTDPTHGTVTVSPNGAYTYTPAVHFAGADSFTYTITDSSGQTATAKVSLTVMAPAAPVAHGDSGTTPYDAPLTVSGDRWRPGQRHGDRFEGDVPYLAGPRRLAHRQQRLVHVHAVELLWVRLVHLHGDRRRWPDLRCPGFANGHGPRRTCGQRRHGHYPLRHVAGGVSGVGAY